MVKSFEAESDVRMQIGDTATLGAWTFRFDGVDEAQGPNYRALRGTLSVQKDGRPLTVLHPEKRLYTVQQMPMTEAAIDTGITRDLYVSLGEPVGDGSWALRLQVKPFVDWIWAGGLLMALGAGLAASDRRYRLRERQRALAGVPKGMAAGGAA
jgi:cytochrome c-type biogenesis protein CcmF